MPTQLRENIKGVFDGEEVIFGPLSLSPGGLSTRKTDLDRVPGRETVWVTNVRGQNMTAAQTLDTAKYLVNRAGNKYRYATEEEIPFTPKRKVYPYDAQKTIYAQEQANVEMTGREVRELAEQGIDPLEGIVSYKEMREIAKQNGINTYRMKKKELAKVLREQKLIE